MCPDCDGLSINGVWCHEEGCPSSWIDPSDGKPYWIDCWECGYPFRPDEKPWPRMVCEDCAHGWPADPDDDSDDDLED